MRYLFYLKNAYSIPVVDPLVKYLQRNKTEDTYQFYVSRKLIDVTSQKWGENNILTQLQKVKLFNPDVVISPENYIDFRIPGYKVQVFHGVGVEKKSHYSVRHFFDLYLTSGPYVTKKFKSLASHYRYFNVIETGWPKFDHILNYAFDKDDYVSELSSKKKIILYAPTFSRKMQSANQLAEHILSEKKEDELWLIKFHDLMDAEIVYQFKAAESNALKIIKENDITPYLHLADVMISDTSSVIYEFLCLGKPVITYNTMAIPEKAIDIAHPEALRPALNQLLENPDFEKDRRTNALLQVNPYLDGQVSKRVFDAIEKAASGSFKHQKSKPANLFRKLRVICNKH